MVLCRIFPFQWGTSQGGCKPISHWNGYQDPPWITDDFEKFSLFSIFLCFVVIRYCVTILGSHRSSSFLIFFVYSKEDNTTRTDGFSIIPLFHT